MNMFGPMVSGWFQDQEEYGLVEVGWKAPKDINGFPDIGEEVKKDEKAADTGIAEEEDNFKS